MPVSPAPHGAAGHQHHHHDHHDGHRGRHADPAGSLLRASAAQRLGFVGVALSVLWAAVFWVMA